MNYPKYEWDPEDRLEYFAKKVQELRKAKTAVKESFSISTEDKNTEDTGDYEETKEE